MDRQKVLLIDNMLCAYMVLSIGYVYRIDYLIFE